MSFEERMLRVLKDPKSNFLALREAAENLAKPKRNMAGFRLTSLPDPWQPPHDPNPAIIKFTSPTAAEVILSAMDRDLAQEASSSNPHFVPHEDLEDLYVFSLVGLGDRRIVPELTKRADKVADVDMRRKWSLACFQLGNPRPLQQFIEDFRTGKMQTLTDQELTGIVNYLINLRLTEADRALYAMADPTHPAQKQAILGIMGRVHERTIYNTSEMRATSFLTHPFCLPIIQIALDDKSETGTTLALSGTVYWEIGPSPAGTSTWTIPSLLKDPSQRKEKTKERRCDQAAAILAKIFVGVPEYHALLHDADDRIAIMKKVLKCYSRNTKPLTTAEKEVLGFRDDEIIFGPDISPLGRPATEADVKAANAIFHLVGKGKSIGIQLPARGVWKIAAKEKEQGGDCLIVQAEIKPDGEILYGIIGRHAIQEARARDFDIVKPFSPR